MIWCSESVAIVDNSCLILLLLFLCCYVFRECFIVNGPLKTLNLHCWFVWNSECLAQITVYRYRVKFRFFTNCCNFCRDMYEKKETEMVKSIEIYAIDLIWMGLLIETELFWWNFRKKINWVLCSGFTFTEI